MQKKSASTALGDSSPCVSCLCRVCVDSVFAQKHLINHVEKQKNVHYLFPCIKSSFIIPLGHKGKRGRIQNGVPMREENEELKELLSHIFFERLQHE